MPGVAGCPTRLQSNCHPGHHHRAAACWALARVCTPHARAAAMASRCATTAATAARDNAHAPLLCYCCRACATHAPSAPAQGGWAGFRAWEPQQAQGCVRPADAPRPRPMGWRVARLGACLCVRVPRKASAVCECSPSATRDPRTHTVVYACRCRAPRRGAWSSGVELVRNGGMEVGTWLVMPWTT